MRFSAQLQSMAKSEILSMIPPYMIEHIKRKDKNPTFKAFIIGQEGEAKATLVGVGKIVKTWFKDAIGKISRQLYSGLRIFQGHKEGTNEHSDREQIGEIAGSRTQDIDGKFSAVMAAYIYPEYKNLPFDVASIEVDVNLDEMDGEVHSINIGEVTAVALGNSAVETPGFPGATFVGEVQAFVENNDPKKGEGMTTLKDVKQFIKDEELNPSDVFTKKTLKEDPYIESYVEEREAEAKKGEFKHRKRTDETFEEKSEEWEKEKEKLEDQIKTLKSESAKSKATELFEKKAGERKLTDRQIKFIDIEREKNFKPEDPDKLNEEVDQFLDSAIEDFKAKAEIFGVKEEDATKEKGGGEPGDESNKEEDDLIPD